MNFELTSDQQMLADTVDRFAADANPPSKAPHLLRTAGREGAGHWRDMAELGWLALPLSEAQGGLGGLPTDIMVVAERLGRHLLPAPFVSSAVVAAPLLGDGALLEQVIAGTTRIALALGDSDARFDDRRIATTATRSGETYVLSGVKRNVADGADADCFIVPARTGGAIDDPDGISLFLVPADATGLRVDRYRSLDNRRNAALNLDGVSATLIGEEGQGFPALERAVQRGVLALCAEAIGAMEALRDITLDYIKTRRQFGQTIGSFQVVQHRMVDIAMQCEEARSMTYRATLECEAGHAGHQRMASAAKARVGQAALFVARQATQLHGGIGTTDELIVSHYYKRLMAIDQTYGNAAYHRGRFGDLAD